MWPRAKTFERLRITKTAALKFAQSTQNGAVGRLTGAHAAAIVRRGEDKFHNSQGQERVFKKSMEERLAPPLRTKQEGTSSQRTQKTRPALSFPVALNPQQWDPGENGLPVLKPVITQASQCLKAKGEDPARKQSSLQMQPSTLISPLAASWEKPRNTRIATSHHVQVWNTSTNDMLKEYCV